ARRSSQRRSTRELGGAPRASVISGREAPIGPRAVRGPLVAEDARAGHGLDAAFGHRSSGLGRDHLERVRRVVPANQLAVGVANEGAGARRLRHVANRAAAERVASSRIGVDALAQDRKSTRLNSSHVKISYAVFCLTKKQPTLCRYVQISGCLRTHFK